MSGPDPYKILQVDAEAESEVIEAAYKRLARKYHPDVSPDPASVERMVRINQAWETLRDPLGRAAVDRARSRTTGTQAQATAAESTYDPSFRSHAPQQTPESTIDSRPARPSSAQRGAGTTGTADRPTSGNGGDSRAMGAGTAGRPPGNPSGSLVTFGRYQGWTLGEIARTDLEYLEWLDRIPIGRTYHAEIDVLLRRHGRRPSERVEAAKRRGLFRRR